jgi:hypothetical protein
MPLPARKAACHPDRPHVARGLCSACYQAAKHGRIPKPPLRSKSVAYCHPERPHAAMGLCVSCYQMFKVKRRPSKEYPREYFRNRHYLTKYGITSAERDAMASAQGNACAICKRTETQPLHLDHCHETGKVRGLLCGPCNQGLGLFREDPNRLRAAAEYLSS